MINIILGLYLGAAVTGAILIIADREVNIPIKIVVVITISIIHFICYPFNWWCWGLSLVICLISISLCQSAGNTDKKMGIK